MLNMAQEESEKLLLENYINGMWREFSEIKNKFQVAPIILAFINIEASAMLSAPDNVVGSRARFLWWVDKFMKKSDGGAYVGLDLYGARCGLFHEYGQESDLSRSGNCMIISWISGGNNSCHGKISGNMIMLSSDQFANDLYDAGKKMLKELTTDSCMNERFMMRLPRILGVKSISNVNR